MTVKLQGLPPPTLPFVNAQGMINQPWYAALQSILKALGTGGDLDNVTASSVTVDGPIQAQNATFSGTVEFGTYVASRFNQTGYILIEDNTGTVRRLMVG